MEQIKLIFISISILLAALGIIHVINTYLHLPDDNPYEQEVEKIIKDSTGLDIDLTPNNQ